MGVIGILIFVSLCVVGMYFLLNILRHFMFILAVVSGLSLAIILLGGGVAIIDNPSFGANVTETIGGEMIEFTNQCIYMVEETTGLANEIIYDILTLWGRTATAAFPIHTKTKKRETPVETLYKDILDTNELPSERVLKEANVARQKERERLQKEIEETQRRIDEIGKTAQMESEKANAKAVREMLKPKVDDETIARIAAQVAREMRAAETESKTQKTA